MIRITDEMQIVRFYAEESNDPYEPYEGVATLLYTSPSIVWIKAMSGTISKTNLRLLFNFLKGKGIKTIRASRAPGKRLPMGTRLDDGTYEIKIGEPDD